MLDRLIEQLQIAPADRDMFARWLDEVVAASNDTGAGASAGVASLSGIGAPLFKGVGGASAGVASLSGIGAALGIGVGGASTGAATAAATALSRATIGVSVKTSGSETTGGLTLTTASVSFSANALAVAIVASAAASAPALSTCTGGGMTTWTQFIDSQFVASNRRLTAFRALEASPGSAAAVVFTVVGTSNTSTCHAILQFTNVNTGGSNGADAIVQSTVTTVGAGQGSVTPTALAALEYSGNEILGIFAADINGTITPDADFTELTDNAIASGNITLETSHATNQTTNTTSFSTNTSSGGVGVLIEIKAA